MKKQSRAGPKIAAPKRSPRVKKPAARSSSEPVEDGARVTSSVKARNASNAFPIVGVGASAGGLEAFTQLLEALPPDTGMGFVFIQHLEPSHPSLLAGALAKATQMPVTQARDGERVEPNHVYVIPPNADLALLHGALTLLPRRTERRPHLPIDFFLRSLAEERGSHAIGVVLSGTASDGTDGLRSIKAEDGITFAQDPTTAKFAGMPSNALDAGVVDYSLAIPELAQELNRLSQHPYVSGTRTRAVTSNEGALTKVIALVRNTVGIDFSEYKAPTVERRLARRMALRRASSLSGYLKLLQDDPKEVRALYEDILIHVTSFFRDPEVFESLRAQVFPDIVGDKAPDDPIRVWVAGCATGEEVYSLAIALLEFSQDVGRSHPIQIFGSDVSETAIDAARTGCFAETRMKEVDAERRRRFFTKVEGGYQITKMVRDLCVFVRHDLAKDPPFSRLDLVSCRNVLIYFDQDLQKRAIATFHYALKPGGVLLLGRTENIAGFSQLFSPLDNANKVFARTGTTSALRFAPRAEVHPVASKGAARGTAEPLPRRNIDAGRRLDRVLLSRYAPPAVLVNDKLEILQIRGDTGPYLRPAEGEPQNNIVKMARTGLVVPLRTAIAQANKEKAPVNLLGLEVDQGGSLKSCDLVVIPLGELRETKEQHLVVLFEPAPARASRDAPRRAKAKPETVAERRRVEALEHQLAATEEYLQSLIEDQDRVNEELNAANEELVSGNEELQSMNEELETAKEELQSTNEELVTVNDELNNRNQEAAQINSDLVNLLSTVDVPILILDAERNIRRFNPKARSILNILPTDVGRPLDDIKSNLRLENLDRRIAEVIESNEIQEAEVQDVNGRWYRMQIRPYRSINNKIDGATMSLVDIDALKHHVREAQQAKAEAERANRAKDEFLATLSHEIRTPLSSMLMQAEMLRRGMLDEEKIKRASEAIERGTLLQLKLINDLLDVSRIVAGKLHVDDQPVDLLAVINAALEGMAAPATLKNVRFAVTLDETIGAVRGDPIRLQQVFSNLLGNAVKFSPDGAQVHVELDRVADQARVVVRDAGIGIDAAFLPHVFNRFTQGDGSTSRRHGGLGLGLAIAHHLVEAQGGTLQVTSEGRGKGATFTVLLPVIPIDSGDPEREEAPATDGGSITRGATDVDQDALRGLRILIVDDDAATRDAVAEMLGQAGGIVDAAASANEAMALLERFLPQVLVCDIAMPDEDGYSLLARVRAKGYDLPALALTAFAGEENRVRALEAGFRSHLTKPVRIDALTRAIIEVASPAASPAE